MAFCRSCGFQMAEDEALCKACGAAVEAVPVAGGQLAAQAYANRPAVSSAWTGGQVLSLVGSAMLAIGPFLAWATAGIFSASGLQKTGNEAVALVLLGIIGAMVALVSLVQKRSVLSVIPLIIGLVGLGMSIYYYAALLDDLSGLDNELFTPTLGAGIYVCLVAGVLVIIGALMGGLKTRKE
jgi:hypothetical protein